MDQIERRKFMQGAALGALALTVGGAEVVLTPRAVRAQGASRSPMTIIDSQVHAYEANTPKRPWYSVPNWPAHATGDEMVAAMDKVGVDGAIFISPFSMYRYDGSYAAEVQQAHPGRFAIVKPVDPDDPAVADVIADWKKTPGTVGIRIILTKESKRSPDDPGIDRICKAAVRYDFPVNVLFWGNLDAGTAAAVGRPAEGLGARQAQERGDQGERRLHVVAEAVSVLRHLGSARAHLRRLGPRPLPVGHRLDPRQRRRQLRAGGHAVSQDRPLERRRPGDAHERRLRQGLSLVAEESLKGIARTSS